MAESPTSRSMRWFRDRKCVPWVVERWIQAARKRIDLWNFADIAVIIPEEEAKAHGFFRGVHFINVTSRSNHSSRRSKIRNSDVAHQLLEACQEDVVIGVMSWKKGSNGLWNMWWEYRDYHMNREALGEILWQPERGKKS